MSNPTHVFPDLDLPFWGWRQSDEGRDKPHTPRAEDYMTDGRYVIRMELPGINPDKDLDIAVEGDSLKVIARRHESEKHEGKRTEFRYGLFSRTIPLPRGVAAENVSADYDKGVLTISMLMPVVQQIPIQVSGL
jgi:HSP20 family molecular chaperone IbpA